MLQIGKTKVRKIFKEQGCWGVKKETYNTIFKLIEQDITKLAQCSKETADLWKTKKITDKTIATAHEKRNEKELSGLIKKITDKIIRTVEKTGQDMSDYYEEGA